MTFEQYVLHNHLRVNVHDGQKHFTLDDMEACWQAAANNIAQIVIDIHNGKFQHLPHRSEDEKQ